MTTRLGEVGEVMHLAKSGRLIVRLYHGGADIRSGELLIDSKGKRVGKVVELIGPVSAPYASVIPMTDRTTRIIGTKIYSGGFMRKQGSGNRDRKNPRSRGQGRGFARDSSGRQQGSA